MFRNLKDLKGYKVCGMDGDIGEAEDFYFDDNSWTIRYVALDKKNCPPGRAVLIPTASLDRLDRLEKILLVKHNKKKIRKCPAVNKDTPVTKEYETAIYRHYGLPLYSGLHKPIQDRNTYGTRHSVPTVAPTLMSANDVMLCRVHTTEGRIGNVDNFIIDDRTWKIRFITADISKLSQEKKVLIAPEWIEKFNWRQAIIYSDVPVESVV